MRAYEGRSAVVDHATFEHVVLTPDKDIYIEVLDISNEDFVRFFFSGPQGGIPRGAAEVVEIEALE